MRAKMLSKGECNAAEARRRGTEGLLEYNIFIRLMPRGKKGESKTCGRHTFMLKPEGPKCYFKEAVQVEFCLNQEKMRSRRGKLGQECYEGPVFNRDKNCAMPSFVLNSQKKKYLKLSTSSRPEDDRRYQDYNDEKSHLMLPKPNNKNTYCNVCKQRFIDYEQHVSSPSHKANLRSSPFNHAISQLEAKYHSLAKERKRSREPMPTVSEFSNLIVIDDDYALEEKLAKPTKKVKRSPQNAQKDQAPPMHRPYQHFNFDIPPPPPSFLPSPYAGLPGQPWPATNFPLYSLQALINLNFYYNVHFLGMDRNYFPYPYQGIGQEPPQVVPCREIELAVEPPKDENLIVISSENS